MLNVFCSELHHILGTYHLTKHAKHCFFSEAVLIVIQYIVLIKEANKAMFYDFSKTLNKLGSREIGR